MASLCFVGKQVGHLHLPEKRVVLSPFSKITHNQQNHLRCYSSFGAVTLRCSFQPPQPSRGPPGLVRGSFPDAPYYKHDAVVPVGLLGYISETKDAHQDPEIIGCAEFAVNQHNLEKNANLQFLRVMEAKEQGVAGVKYYITLEALDDGKPSIYGAAVWVRSWLNKMDLVEWKHLDDAF